MTFIQYFHARTLVQLLVAAVSALAAGCSIRPLPEDVTRYDTYEITQRIRCEFRAAIQRRVVLALRSQQDAPAANALETGQWSFRHLFDIGLKTLNSTNQDLLNRYRVAYIAYEFEFDLAEENNLGGSVSLLDTLTRGQLNLAVSGKKDRKRQNKRNFKATDNFEELITSSVMDRVCSTRLPDIMSKNWIYPIDGHLGLNEVVDTFIGLNQSGNLVGNTIEGIKIPTLADTIIFTTTLSGTVNPVLKLAPLGKHLQVTDASLNATSSRTDMHKLVIAMTLPSSGTKLTNLTVAQQRAQSERQRARVEQAAIIELDRQRVKQIDAETEIIRRTLLRQ